MGVSSYTRRSLPSFECCVSAQLTAAFYGDVACSYRCNESSLSLGFDTAMPQCQIPVMNNGALV
jgi:hypothetical protein